MMIDPTVTRAIKAAGSAAALAEHLGVTRSAVSQWKHIPSWHIAKVSEVTGIPIGELVPAQRKDAAQ